MRFSAVTVRMTFRWLAALLFIAAGFNHFRVPRMYEAIVPPHFPQPRLLVAVSGILEVIGGGALLIPAARRSAAYGLVALLIAVFPANVWMAVGPRSSVGQDLPLWLLLARLPLQGVLIVWVWWIGIGSAGNGERSNDRNPSPDADSRRQG